MFDYLQKFNNLPKSLRDKVSSPEAMRSISDLENKYLVDLAAVIMKVMTKTLLVNDLMDYFVNEFSLTKEKAESLKLEITEKIFYLVGDYLGLEKNQPKNNINDFSAYLIKQANLSLPSEDLYLRLRNIFITYLKGVRNVVDTKNSLMKKVEFGGLNLSQEEADRVIRIIKSQDLTETKVEEVEKPKIKTDLKEEVEDIIKTEIKLQENLVQKKLNEDYNNKNKIDINQPNNQVNSKEKLNRIIMEAEAATSPLFIQKKINKEQAVKEKEQVIKETEQATGNKEEDKGIPSQALLVQPEKTLLFKDKKTALLASINQHKLLTVAKEEKKIEQVISQEKVSSLDQINNLSQEVDIKKDLESHEKNNHPSLISNHKPEKEILKKEENEVVTIKQAIDVKTVNKNISEVKEGQIDTAKTININFNRPQTISSKPRMDDIKPVVRIMSPIDELKFLDLVNFRRLGENANEIILKIFNKIKLLEKDGYDKMVLGVKAWRQSEVNRLYVKMGQEAIIKGLPLKELVIEKQKNNKPYLKIEEINAISHLNSRLSF